MVRIGHEAARALDRYNLVRAHATELCVYLMTRFVARLPASRTLVFMAPFPPADSSALRAA